MKTFYCCRAKHFEKKHFRNELKWFAILTPNEILNYLIEKLLSYSILYLTFEECRKKQTELTKHSCTQNETTEAVSLVHHLLDIFMESSHCSEYYLPKSNSSYNTYYHSIIFLIIYHFTHSVILSLNHINISNEWIKLLNLIHLLNSTQSY
jgi:hypothetical protein